MISTFSLRCLEGPEFLLRGQLSEGHSVCVCVCVCRGVPLVTYPQYATSGSSSLQTGHIEPEGCHMPFQGWRVRMPREEGPACVYFSVKWCRGALNLFVWKAGLKTASVSLAIKGPHLSETSCGSSTSSPCPDRQVLSPRSWGLTQADTWDQAHDVRYLREPVWGVREGGKGELQGFLSHVIKTVVWKERV